MNIHIIRKKLIPKKSLYQTLIYYYGFLIPYQIFCLKYITLIFFKDFEPKYFSVFNEEYLIKPKLTFRSSLLFRALVAFA